MCVKPDVSCCVGRTPIHLRTHRPSLLNPNARHPYPQANKYAFKCHRRNEGGKDVVYPVHSITFHGGELLAVGVEVCVRPGPSWNGVEQRAAK